MRNGCIIDVRARKGHIPVCIQHGENLMSKRVQGCATICKINIWRFNHFNTPHSTPGAAHLMLYMYNILYMRKSTICTPLEGSKIKKNFGDTPLQNFFSHSLGYFIE